MANLLVVEDDIVTNEAICEYMKSAGHTTLSAFDGEQGLLMAKDPSVDLVVLDIMLPKMDGMTVLKELRKSRTVPTLMLTAIEDEHTQVTSFDAEADDYITKPFSMVLLGKRITALLRRSGKSPELSQIQFGDITVNFSGYTAWNQEGQIDLTPKEIELLKLLVEHKGLVLTRSQILDELWGYDTKANNLSVKAGSTNVTTNKGYVEVILLPTGNQGSPSSPAEWLLPAAVWAGKAQL